MSRFHPADPPPFASQEQQDQFCRELQALLERYRVRIGICIEELTVERVPHDFPIEVQVRLCQDDEYDASTRLDID